MGKAFELEGKVKLINDVQTFGSGFTKREFVIEVEDGKYPQLVKFECVKDKTTLTDGLNVDDPVKVTFDVRGNEYKGRYYVNLNAWKLESLNGDQKSGSADQSAPAYGDEDAPPSHASEPTGDFDDDIPF